MIFKWFDERLELKKFKDKFLSKTFPTHPLFLLGETALFSFITLVVTGIFLGFLYEPSTKMVSLFGAMVPAAYASVVRIDLLPMGLIVRRIHHWSAMIMIAAILAHLLRVYFTGAYRKPREINWLVGLSLWGTAMIAAFTGYLLPYSQFSVTATSIAYYMAKSMPWIGDWMSSLLFAGDFPFGRDRPPLLLHACHADSGHADRPHQPAHAHPDKTETYRAASNKGRKEAQGGKRLIGIPIWPEQAVISLSLFPVPAVRDRADGDLYPLEPDRDVRSAVAGNARDEA